MSRQEVRTMRVITEDIQNSAGGTPTIAGMTVSELERLDGVTEGIVTASKAVVVDANKDIGSFRNVAQTGTLTVGVNDTGADVKFFGATAGKYWLWDESADLMNVVGGAAFGGNTTFGANDAGVDVVFYGDTASKYAMWDTSADKFIVEGAIDLNEGVTLDATAASGVTHLIKDAAGKTLLATGAAVPADAGAVYAKGCLFIDTDVATGTSGLYVNVGTSASCVFKLVSNAA